jgi:hypothetical protein
MTSSKRHVIAIEDITESKEAFVWCKEMLQVRKWNYWGGSNQDYFYFDDEKDAQYFLTVHGGRYVDGR